ncbi:hypothetical protein ACFO9Q_20390 [Paenibacillus sp. GCM10023252]|uniref:hypothetical protein n=1 Tax=Paenibacillus sp. GCM10023252 TaxID=3252649 RepID=UPI0036177AC9
MKKSLIIVVALLAISGVMAAMAFTSATVTNSASFTISKTTGALLAMTKGNHAAAYYGGPRGEAEEHLIIDLAKGRDGLSFGVQKNSTYQWDKLFQVTNNNENPVKLQVYLATNATQQGKFSIKGNGDTNWAWVTNALAVGDNKEFYQSGVLQPGQSVWLDLKYEAKLAQNNWQGTETPNIVVKAVSVVE